MKVEITESMAKELLEAEAFCRLGGQAGLPVNMLKDVADAFPDLVKQYPPLWELMQ